MLYANMNSKEVGMTMLKSHKVDLRTKKLSDREWALCKIKVSSPR